MIMKIKKIAINGFLKALKEELLSHGEDFVIYDTYCEHEMILFEGNDGKVKSRKKKPYTTYVNSIIKELKENFETYFIDNSDEYITMFNEASDYDFELFLNWNLIQENSKKYL